MINTCIKKRDFRDKLETADITLAFKMGDKYVKSNYRPVCYQYGQNCMKECLYKQKLYGEYTL